MKLPLAVLIAAALAPLCARAAESATVSTTLAPESGRIVVEARGVPPAPPLVFSAAVEQTVRTSLTEITGELRVRVRVAQGRPEVFTLGLTGDGEITGVTGAGLRDWSVRQAPAGGRRFLDLRVALPEKGALPAESEFVVRARQVRAATTSAVAAAPVAILIVAPGEAVGFTARITLQADTGVDLRVMGAAGLTPFGEAGRQFFATGDARLEVRIAPRGAAPEEVELTGTQLTGRVNAAAHSIDFQIRAQVRAQKAGARLQLLAGAAAPSGVTAGDGWHLELAALGGGRFAHELVCERAGTFALDLAFAAAVGERGDWRGIEFAMPAGAVVPLRLEGLDGGVSFKTDLPVVPARSGDSSTSSGQVTWAGFLPADGMAALAWRHGREAAEGALAFTSHEETEARVGAGVWRQVSRVAFRVLQGKLTSVRVRLDGPGEILGVTGPNVTGWSVATDTDGRLLDVRLSRPIEAEGTLSIRSQAELGGWPARAEPLRLRPIGGVRHAGFLRLAGLGAVKLEVTEATGLTQLAPAQWPGSAEIEPEARSAAVYRFPVAGYACRVLAMPVQPEVAIALVATFELAEAARVIDAAIELEVREAALRDWTLRVPADHAVVALTGAEVADYAVEGAAEGGLRAVRVVFRRPVEGRQLLVLRLEKNAPAAAGAWQLPMLEFPGAKSVRGQIGAIAAPGYRLAPARIDRLTEVPPAFFPKQVTGLQHAWRLREAEWTAELTVEALGRSVQADVFHLHTVREGAVRASVLLNFFVVGAPASEWRIELPATAGNVDVTGQNVRRDWRREGDQLVVSLHQPVLGAATLLVTFEEPLSARGGAITPGRVRPLGVQAERGFVHVVSPLQVKHAVRAAEGGLLRLEPGELPAEFRLLSGAPSLAVFHYTARPFALELAIERHAPGETVEQVVDFASLASRVSADGQIVTEAVFYVKTRGRKALRLALPAGTRLWEVRVDGEIAAARADGAHTIVPLPARSNPNDPVPVALRLGQAAGAGHLKLIAPRVAGAPTVIGEWTVRGDAGRQLVPRGGPPPLAPALTETGFEWIAQRGGPGPWLLLAVLALAAVLRRAEGGWRRIVALVAATVAIAGAGLLAGAALTERRENLSELTFATAVVPADALIALELDHVAAWRSGIVAWGLAAIVGGVALVIAGGRAAALRVAGVIAIAAGVLAQHGGAVAFFGLVALAVLGRAMAPVLRGWRRAAPVPPASGTATVASLAFLLIALGGGRNEARAQEPAEPRPAQAIVQTWSIRGDRLFAEAEVTVRGAAGESFLLLRAPAVLTEFKGDGLRIGKTGAAYRVALEREGAATARVRYELPVPDRARPIVLPMGPAAAQRVTVELDQGGWEFFSEAAVQIAASAAAGEGRSGATLVLAPHAAASITLQPRRRDPAAEATVLFAETASLFTPGPGVVNGRARVTVRPAQGRVSAIELEVPAGLAVGEVSGGPVGAWRFDPEKRRLHVAIEPAQVDAFSFMVETQLGAGEPPYALALEPLRVPGAAGAAGLIALAFGGDTQPEGVRAAGLATVNAQDFDTALVPRTRDGQPAATVLHAWRHGAEGGRVELNVAPVAAEVRVASRQTLSLDDDRMVLAVDLRATIARAGLFRLSFALPEGLELEAASGEALSHWTEAQEGEQRRITLHLRGRMTGELGFALSLAGPAPRPQAAWPWPRLTVREAARQTAEALVVPGRGLRLRAVERENATPLDPRELGAPQPGALAFRLLQGDWTLKLGIDALEPWVTVQALQEVTVREGQTLTRLALRYRVENAAVKTLQVKLPGLGDERARTVRATGAAVAEIVRVPAADDLWEIRFQRSVAGETDVQIEFQGAATLADETERVATPEFPGTRQAVQFVAVRGGGRLELAAPTPPRGWTRADWGAVPAPLQSRGDRSAPTLCFRVAEPEGALAVTVRRHELAEALKLRVTQGDLLTLFSPAGAALTAAELRIEVIEKGSLRLRLPAGARLLGAVVNGEGAPVVREGEAWLLPVAADTATGRAAAVRLIYATDAAGSARVALAGPGLGVPLENVTWRVVLPPGFTLTDHAGSLRFVEEGGMSSFRVGDYTASLGSKRATDAKQAMSLLAQAGAWMAAGEQDKAGAALSQASNNLALDAAANEDARVQLHKLRTQQTLLSLNTRRQRLYLDNRADTARNDLLERAAGQNPFMQGKLNFNPAQAEQLLLGNTAEENSALRGIAARFVEQQLAAEPPPATLDVTLPARGRVLTFTRALQVDGAAPLELRLGVKPTDATGPAIPALLLVALAALAAWELRRQTA